MTTHSIARVFVASLWLTACAHTEFTAFEPADREFRGEGTKVVVNGMDVWTFGQPTRRFRILGILDDERPEIRVYKWHLWWSMTDEARGVNGDALIDLTYGHHALDTDPPQGFDSSFPSAGCATARLTTTWTTWLFGLRYQTKFAVVDYLE